MRKDYFRFLGPGPLRKFFLKKTLAFCNMLYYNSNVAWGFSEVGYRATLAV